MPESLHPDAFQVRRVEGIGGDAPSWEVLDAAGRHSATFNNEAAARFHAAVLRRQSRGGAHAQADIGPPSPPPPASSMVSPLGPEFWKRVEQIKAAQGQFPAQPVPPPPVPPPPMPPASQATNPFMAFARAMAGASGGAGAGDGIPPLGGVGAAPPPPPPPGGVGAAPPPPPPQPPGGGSPYQQFGPGAFPPGMRRHARSRRPRRPQPPPNFGRRFARAFRHVYPTASAFGAGGLQHAAQYALAVAAPEAKIIADVTRIFKDTLRAMHDFAEGVNAANRELTRFSPLLAREFAHLTVGDFRRGFGMAQYTEQTAATLVRSIDRMRDSLFPYQVAGRNVENTFANINATLISDLANHLSYLPAIFEWLRSNLDPTGGRSAAFVQGTIQVAMQVFQQMFPQFGGMGMVDKILKALKDAGIIPDVKPGPHVNDPWTNFILNKGWIEHPQPGPFNGKFQRFNPAVRR